jgi:hypothetical protein
MGRSVVGREVHDVRKGHNAFIVRVLYCLSQKVKEIGIYETSQLLITLRYSLMSQMICTFTNTPLRTANLAFLGYSLSIKYSITSHRFMNFEIFPIFLEGALECNWNLGSVNRHYDFHSFSIF